MVVTVDERVINLVHPATTRSTVVGVIHELDRRRVLLTTPSTCVAKLCKSRVWSEVPEGSNFIFKDIRISLLHSLG